MSSTRTVPTHHSDGPRASTSYRTPPPPPDPRTLGSDVTVTWPLLVVTLLLVPPLGALQLRHRVDLPLGLRVAIAVVATAVVTLAWATGLGLGPLV